MINMRDKGQLEEYHKGVCLATTLESVVAEETPWFANIGSGSIPVFTSISWFGNHIKLLVQGLSGKLRAFWNFG